jgi:hypothetical protein
MTLIVLGTPAIALAGTISPGSGAGQPGQPGQVVACARLHGKLPRPRLQRVRLHGRHRRITLSCPLPKGCLPRPLTFDMASGSSTLTEVSGPVLAPPEEFRYDGQTYTIMTVNPGAGSFTVFRDGMLFVNAGPAITGAKAVMLCSPPPVRLKRFLT